MKKILIYFITIIISNSSIGQQTTEMFGLKGNVNFIEESNYEFIEKFGEVEIGDFLGRTCMAFNSKNLLVKKYDIRGGKDSKDTINLISYEYVYNENGLLKEINEFEQYSSRSKKSLSFKTKLKYDEKKNLIQEFIYFGNGEFKEGFKISYEDGKMIKEATDSDGNILEINNEGVVMFPDEMINENGNELQTSYTDTQDANGNWIKRIEFKGKKQKKGYERKIIYF